MKNKDRESRKPGKSSSSRLSNRQAGGSRESQPSPKENTLTARSGIDRFPKPDPWIELRQFTAARIALGRAGHSQRTSDLLRFQLDHSRARDAIHGELDIEKLRKDLTALDLPILTLESSARDRNEYLRRPDLGRSLSAASESLLHDFARGGHPPSITFVLVDGLSARAIQEHAVPFLQAYFQIAGRSSIGPLCIASRGRVALGDPVGAILQSSLVVVLIGERPGLSSPDSMGLYMTFEPRIGTTDERRNCISNIRTEGLAPGEAAKRFHYLAGRSLKGKLSGVFLKDDRAAELE